jgi:signal transduction histidine kinase/DNA-binding response OmpR family regulator/ligand-binding sensor domain-containing protein
VYRLIPETGRIFPVIHDSVHTAGLYEGTETSDIIHFRTIFEDKRGNIWVGDVEGLHRFDSLYGSFKHYYSDPADPTSLSSNKIHSIYEDREGNLWVGTLDGLNRLERNGHCFQRYFHNPDNSNSLSGNCIGAISEDFKGNLVVKTNMGIDFMDKQSGNFVTWEFIDLYFNEFGIDNMGSFFAHRYLHIDENGIMWFASDYVYKVMLVHQQFLYAARERDNYSPAYIHHDRNGDIWIGTWGEGLYRMVSDGSGNSRQQLKNIMSDGILSDAELYHYPSNPEDTFSLQSKYIASICRDREGTLWIGGGRTGILYEMDTSDNRERFIPYGQGEVNVNDQWKLTEIHEDRDGNLWIGRTSGLYIFERKQKKFFPYVFDLGKEDFGNILFVNDIQEGKSGCIWIGTWFGGLYKIIPPITISPEGLARGKRTISYKYDDESPKDLGDFPILSICEPGSGNAFQLWVGTFGGGLFGLKAGTIGEGDNDQFTRYTISDGLPHNTIWAMLEDLRGDLWLGTDHGLARFNPESGEFRIYNEVHGTPLGTSNWLSGQQGKNGEFFYTYFDGGLLVFNPDSIRYNEVIPPVVFTDLKLFNEPVPIGADSPLKRSITETKELELSYRENYLSFEFAALNYLNPEKNLYKYKMEGLDRDWIESGYLRQASYSNLKSGKYIFRVQGSNNDGVWNEEGASLGIIIHPPPWFRWWAYVLYGLIVIMIIRWYRNFLITRERLKADLQLEKIEVEKVQELDRMKSRFFANISHEFRTPLTLILGPIDRLLANRPKVAEFDWNLFHIMKRNAEKLKALINQILDLSKLDTGQAKLQLSKGSITEFLKNIVLSYLSLAESKTINYKHDLARASADLYFDGDKLEKIAGNLISNAFKFTPEGGRISVKLAYIMDAEDNVPEYLELIVKDSGIGIPEGKLDKIFSRYYQVDDPDAGMQEGSGLGLALTKELVDLYRGEINVDSVPGKGSTFTVRLPIHERFFAEDEKTVVIEKDKEEMYIPDPEMPVEEIIAMDNDEPIVSSPDIRTRPVVLIVEDNHDLRKFIIQGLDDLYQILEAENGLEGLDRAIEEIPDLVITDLMMPEMDGLEMCKRLKADERTSHIPVIILTARAERASKLEGLESHVDDYIIKPFDQEELKTRARNLIEQRRLLREKFKYAFFLKERGLDLKSTDERFIKKAIDTVKSHLDDPDLNVNILSEKLGVSNTQLYRKIHGLTNQSPSEFIRNLRLQHSALLLNKNYDNIAQIAYQVGFSNHSYFSKCFRELYGISPVEYAKRQIDYSPPDL